MKDLVIVLNNLGGNFMKQNENILSTATVKLLTMKELHSVRFMDVVSDFYVEQWLEENTDYAWGIFKNETDELMGYCTIGCADDTMDIHDIMQPILTRSERIDNERISCLLNSGYKDIKTLIQENKKIGSEESMYLEFRFRLKDTSGRQKSGRYILETDNTQIIYEHLEFVLSKNLGTYFSITPTNTIINPKIFLEKTAYQSLQEACNKYWGKHSLLAILLHEIKDKADTYIKNQLSVNFKTVLNFLLNISCKTSRGKHQQNMLGLPPEVLSELEEGNISVYKENILNRTENILNVFLKNIDTDIQKVYYEKSVAGMFIRYKLMVCRRINEVNRELPFSLESTGIQFMIQLLPFILNLQKGAVVIIDAFDIALCDDFVKKTDYIFKGKS